MSQVINSRYVSILQVVVVVVDDDDTKATGRRDSDDEDDLVMYNEGLDLPLFMMLDGRITGYCHGFDPKDD